MQKKIVVTIKPIVSAELFEKTGDDWKPIKKITDIEIRDIFEIGVPFSDLGAKEKDELNLFISVLKNGEEIERCPWRGYISLNVPTAEFEAMLWY